MTRRWRHCLVAVLGFVSTLVAYAAPSGAAPSISAGAYAVIDAQSGELLASDNLHAPLLAASTVKLMTAITALDLIPADAMITVSPNAASRPAMRIGMQAGQQWKLRDTIRSLIMVSANDAAYALAEQASGSVEAFAAAMAAKGRQLGLRDSTFADPAGLDGADSLLGPSMMSVYDLAIVARVALTYPEVAAAAAAPTYEFVGGGGAKHRLLNHNKMLPGAGAAYAGVIGLKTGFTKAAKQCFVAAANRNGRTVIVAMLAGNTLYGPVASLLDFGFATPATPATAAGNERLPALVTAKLNPVPVSATPEPAVAEASAGAPTGGVASAAPTDERSGGGRSPLPLTLALVLAASFLVLWFRPKARRSRARLRRERRRRQLTLVASDRS